MGNSHRSHQLLGSRALTGLVAKPYVLPAADATKQLGQPRKRSSPRLREKQVKVARPLKQAAPSMTRVLMVITVDGKGLERKIDAQRLEIAVQLASAHATRTRNSEFLTALAMNL